MFTYLSDRMHLKLVAQATILFLGLCLPEGGALVAIGTWDCVAGYTAFQQLEAELRRRGLHSLEVDRHKRRSCSGVGCR